MESILIKNLRLNLNSKVQISPSGRPIRLSAISKNLQVPHKFFKDAIKYHWIYTFRFLDAADGFVSFEFDYEDNFLHKL